MNRKICNICHSTKFKQISATVRDSKKHKVIQCQICNHIQMFPIPTPAENKKFYDEDRMSKNLKIHSIKVIEEKSEFDTQMNVELSKKIASKKDKILEIGSGYGYFLKKMKENGFDIIGIEVSKSRREYSKRISNADVFDYDLNFEQPAIGLFDFIVLFHVMEYIANPINFLNNVRTLLKTNGKIIIRVPNSNDLQLKLNTYYRKWFWQRAHVNYFSPPILKHILEKSSFKKIKISGIQRYSIENLFVWKLTHKPQLKKPTYSLPKSYQFIEIFYKKYLEKKLICDTLLSIAQK